jgi:hypothetical protein
MSEMENEQHFDIIKGLHGAHGAFFFRKIAFIEILLFLFLSFDCSQTLE